jgi:hypothetical protein
MKMRKLRIGIYITILLILTGCSSGDIWEGVVFPDRGNLLIHQSAGQFESLDTCQASSTDRLRSMNSLQKGYYECRKNCKSDLAAYNGDCEETVRGNFYK